MGDMGVLHGSAPALHAHCHVAVLEYRDEKLVGSPNARTGFANKDNLDLHFLLGLCPLVSSD